MLRREMALRTSPFAVRLAVFYAAVFLVIGIFLPFWPVWLASRGLDAVQIGWVTAIGIVARVVTNPLIAHAADRWGERRRSIIRLSLTALAVFTLFLGAEGFVAIALVSVLFATCWMSIMPLTESLTMLVARVERLDYGRIRLWGSLSFIAAAAVGGWFLTGRSADAIFWCILASLAVAAALTPLLPDVTMPKMATGRLPLAEVLRDRTFLIFLGAATLIQGSHAVLYSFGTLHWQFIGYSETTIGLLWAEGVIAEIMLFAYGTRLLRYVSPVHLLLLGALAGLVRWTAIGFSDSLLLLIGTQALHAFTFGAAHLGAIHFIAHRIEPGLSATAQSLYASVVGGLGIGLATVGAGHLYAAYGGRAYGAMAFCSLGGTVLSLVLIGRSRKDER